jgi:hypothetical protein
MPHRPTRTPPRLPLLLATAALLVAATPRAHAQAPTPDRVAAESLFAEARQLLAAGHFPEACAKLEASRRLEPAIGTTLNLADCYERIGRTASAWAEFKTAAAEAQKIGDSLRKTEALERAHALEPRLSRLRVDLDQPGARIISNGVPFSPAAIGSAIAIDPGSYHFEASAPGKRPWSQTIDIAANQSLAELRVPPLADEPIVTPTPPPISEPPPMTTDSGPDHTLAWALGGVGTAALATGAIFTALAASSWSKAEGSCADYPYGCTPQGLDHADTAGTRATIATVFLLAGGSALATSIVLFVTSTEDPESPELALSPAGLHLRGSF